MGAPRNDSAAGQAGLTRNCDYHPILGELFHLLSQPLTGLRCSLALSLKRSRARSRSRTEIAAALKQVERISWLNASIHALVEAGEPATRGESCALADCLTELVDELSPVARAKRVELRLAANHRLPIAIGTQQVRSALFHLLDFALFISAQRTKIVVKAEAAKDCIFTLQVTPAARMSRILNPISDRETPNARDASLQCRVRLAIARKILEGAGAKFHAHSSAGRLFLHFHLPTASQETAQPLTPPLRRPA